MKNLKKSTPVKVLVTVIAMAFVFASCSDHGLCPAYSQYKVKQDANSTLTASSISIDNQASSEI